MKERNGVYEESDGGGGDFGKRENAFLITNAMDNVYYLTNLKFVGPLAFAKSLICSKTGAIFVKITLLYFVFLLTFISI